MPVTTLVQVPAGSGTLQTNSSGTENTGDGRAALFANTTGSNNTAEGAGALLWTTGASDNTAVGEDAMTGVTGSSIGSENTAVGQAALESYTSASNNTAVGWFALVGVTDGDNNTAIGMRADDFVTNGSGDTALGVQAGRTETAANALTTGVNDTFLGYDSGPGTTMQLTNATAIGANALVSEDNALVLGNGAKVGIGTSTPSSALEVVGKIKSTDLSVTNTINGSIDGNAATVTNGVYTSGDQTIGGNKTFSSIITGSISGNAGTVTNGVYTTGDQSVDGSKTFTSTINGNISGSASSFTGSLVGDVTGHQGSTKVSSLQGYALDLSTAPTNGQVLTYNFSSSTWVPTSIAASSPLSTTVDGSGATTISLGTVPTGKGGTGITSAPTAAGQFLRSTASGTWGISGLQPSDIPSGSNNYIQNQTTLQSAANFNIDGSGSVGQGTGATGTLFTVGKPSTTYGTYLQLPLVSTSGSPPANACNTTTFVGRTVVQYIANGGSTASKVIIWVCTSGGTWTHA